MFLALMEAEGLAATGGVEVEAGGELAAEGVEAFRRGGGDGERGEAGGVLKVGEGGGSAGARPTFASESLIRRSSGS